MRLFCPACIATFAAIHALPDHVMYNKIDELVWQNVHLLYSSMAGCFSAIQVDFSPFVYDCYRQCVPWNDITQTKLRNALAFQSDPLSCTTSACCEPGFHSWNDSFFCMRMVLKPNRVSSPIELSL